MKRLTSVIALLLVATLLLVGCNTSGFQGENGTLNLIYGTTTEETTTEESQPEETTPPDAEPLPDPVLLDPACEHDFTSRIVLEQVTTMEDGKIANVCGNCGGWQEEILAAVKSIKILAIGNSFSDNALNYLPALAKELGIAEVIVGKLYRGSCTIDRHWSDAQAGNSYERFDLNTGSGWVTQSTKTLIHALTLHDWDIITMQQSSGVSGMTSSLGNLQNLIDYVNANKTNPDAKLYWHMTWAYAFNSTHGSFGNYNSDQMTMYNAIVDVSKNYIVDNGSFAGIIPAGTAVQNYRDRDTQNASVESTYITTDGYHLRNYSQVIVSMTWLRTLTGLSLDGITCKSTTDLSFVESYRLKTMKKAAEYAYLNPYEVNFVY